MIQKPSDFIGRKKEFALFDQLIHQKMNLAIVCIDGPGGIGKTRLLQEIQSSYQNTHGLFISKIFDFDDPAYHIFRNFRLAFAEQLDAVIFRPYLNALEDFRNMELANVSPEKLLIESEAIDQIFIKCFNENLAKKQRVLLFFDTLETIQDEYIWKNYLLRQIPAFKNTTIILAGRKLDEIREDLEALAGKDSVTFVALPGFSLAEMNEYFDWRRIGKAVDNAMREKIHILVDGKPILIDLAIDWLSHDVPLPEALGKPLEEIKQFDSTQLNTHREQFEQALVIEVLSFIKPIDRAILDMACIHRFYNPEIMAFLLGVSLVRAKEMMRHLSNFTFVRIRPQNNYTLHDEMRRMVNNYAWPKYDPFGTQKKKTHARLTDYYYTKLKDLENQLQALQDQLLEIRNEGHKEQEIQISNEAAAREREYWLLRIEYLHHALRSDLNKALKIFIESADKATEQFRYEYRRAIFDEMLQFEQHFKLQDQYEIYIRQAKYSLDKGKYELAYHALQNLLAKHADGSHREVDILIQLGNATIRMGRPNETLQYFHRALEICQQKRYKNWLGVVYNELGWTNRMLGKWDEGIKYYDLAMDHNQKMKDTMNLADTLNNQGFIYNLKGDYSSALIYCQQALEIRQQLNLTRDIGMSYNTMSIIYRNRGDYEASLNHSNNALAIFRAQNDIEWLGKVYRERGVTRWLTNQLELARTDIEKSLSIFEKYEYNNELPTTYFRLAHVLWELGRSNSQQARPNNREFFEQAENLFNRSIRLGMDIADIYITFNSLSALIELLYDYSEIVGLNRVSELRQLYKKLQKLDQESDFHYPLSIGNADRIMGAVEQDAHHFSQALNFYKKGFPLIARHSNYHRYAFDRKALTFLDKKISQLPPAIAKKWCEALIDHWKSENLDSQYPEFINYCKVWQIRVSWR
ncbi:ATP-binding protein [candidate division KSB1 bacterium]|nr:ATP-binding protein [candidate division KSB1 bacterium]